MKILFLCGSAEHGKDGVGDYTRRLCGELIRRGHEAQIVSLCDKQARYFITETQIIEEKTVTVSRIPVGSTNQQRMVWTQAIINTATPDWISLQFVPYSFHPKGLPFWLPKFLKKLKGNHKWHVMFHELWVGMNEESSIKFKVVGFLQQKIILKMLEKFENLLINTHTNLYQQKIINLGYATKLLPLFSNISNVNLGNALKVKENSKEIRFVFFGGMHYGAPVQHFIDALKRELKNRKGAFLKFVFIGNCGNAIQEWTSILKAENIQYVILGYCTDQEISANLLSCDYGISTTPYLLIQKSGSVAALLENYLPVLCVARKWNVSKIDEAKTHQIVNALDFYDDGIQKLFNHKIAFDSINTLNTVTNSLLENLMTNSILWQA